MKRAMYDELNKLELKPEVWCRMFETAILDPDGWREDDKDFEEPIILSEFVRRMYVSTIHLGSGSSDMYDCEDFAKKDGAL